MKTTSGTGWRQTATLVSAQTYAALAVICMALCTQGCSNLHHIDAGWWRSAQPRSSWLNGFLEEETIDVILTLRGHHPGKDDYDRELKTATQCGTDLVAIRLSSRRQPSRAEVISILDFIERYGDKRVLVHCRGGANRTSLVAFLYLVEHRGWSKLDAETKALRWYYGHFSSPLLPWSAPAIDEFVASWISGDWARKTYGMDREQSP